MTESGCSEQATGESDRIEPPFGDPICFVETIWRPYFARRQTVIVVPPASRPGLSTVISSPENTGIRFAGAEV